MARSLLRQLEQIRRTATYDDAVANVNTSAVAEPTVSGSLEDDANVIRTILKQLKGGTNWYDDPGKYFDPTDTDNANITNKQISLANIKGNTLDSKTVIIAVSEDNGGLGYTVSGTSTGILLSLSTTYADDADRRGLPIFNSIAHTGNYHDEAGADNVCRIDVLDMSNDQEFQNGSGHTIHAKFHDAADFGGTGEGTDVYVRFYANGSVVDLTGTDVTGVKFVYPQRKRMSDMAEHEWLRTDFVSSFEGDVELTEDISNLWNYTGAVDNDTAPSWVNIAASYILNAAPTDLEAAINDLNDGIGDRLYTEDNYLTDGEDITVSLDALDQQVKDNADAIAASSEDKYVESVSVVIPVNTAHTIPSAQTYTPCSTAEQEGKNMDIYVDGQLLSADTGANGVNADRDYGETSSTTITFRFRIQAGRNITYIIRQ